MILRSAGFNISNYNRNVLILVKMRDQPTSGQAPLPRYGIFLHFQPFSAILASFELKMTVFGADVEIKRAQYFKLQKKCADSP